MQSRSGGDFLFLAAPRQERFIVREDVDHHSAQHQRNHDPRPPILVRPLAPGSLVVRMVVVVAMMVFVGSVGHSAAIHLKK